MDISSEILETLDIMGNKSVIEVLKDDVAEQDIIVESEATEDMEEIEEIIEIIEEIVEDDENSSDKEISLSRNKDKILSSTEKNEVVVRDKTNNETTGKKIEVFGFDEENSMFTSLSRKEETTKRTSNTQKSNSKKQVINYDVDEDWQDEELDRIEELDNTERSVTEVQSQSISKNNKKAVNNQSVSMSLQSNRLDMRNHMDSMTRSDKSRMDSGSIGSNVHNVEDNSDNHEIVKNMENNLLYTVLGTKKQDSSTKQQEKFNDSQYIKVGILSIS